jgi:hypothetical protein
VARSFIPLRLDDAHFFAGAVQAFDQIGSSLASNAVNLHGPTCFIFFRCKNVHLIVDKSKNIPFKSINVLLCLEAMLARHHRKHHRLVPVVPCPVHRRLAATVFLGEMILKILDFNRSGHEAHHRDTGRLDLKPTDRKGGQTNPCGKKPWVHRQPTARSF